MGICGEERPEKSVTIRKAIAASNSLRDA